MLNNMEKKGAFLEYNGARLELLETIGVTYVPKRPERPYCPHLCFETNNMDEVIETLKKIILKFSMVQMKYPVQKNGCILWI